MHFIAHVSAVVDPSSARSTSTLRTVQKRGTMKSKHDHTVSTPRKNIIAVSTVNSMIPHLPAR